MPSHPRQGVRCRIPTQRGTSGSMCKSMCATGLPGHGTCAPAAPPSSHPPPPCPPCAEGRGSGAEAQTHQGAGQRWEHGPHRAHTRCAQLHLDSCSATAPPSVQAPEETGAQAAACLGATAAPLCCQPAAAATAGPWPACSPHAEEAREAQADAAPLVHPPHRRLVNLGPGSCGEGRGRIIRQACGKRGARATGPSGACEGHGAWCGASTALTEPAAPRPKSHTAAQCRRVFHSRPRWPGLLGVKAGAAAQRSTAGTCRRDGEVGAADLPHLARIKPHAGPLVCKAKRPGACMRWVQAERLALRSWAVGREDRAQRRGGPAAQQAISGPIP